jgi:hypothetical protein
MPGTSEPLRVIMVNAKIKSQKYYRVLELLTFKVSKEMYRSACGSLEFLCPPSCCCRQTSSGSASPAASSLDNVFKHYKEVFPVKLEYTT